MRPHRFNGQGVSPKEKGNLLCYIYIYNPVTTQSHHILSFYDNKTITLSGNVSFAKGCVLQSNILSSILHDK